MFLDQNLNGRLNFDLNRANIVDLENMFVYLHQQAFRNFASKMYKIANVAEPVQNIRNIFIRNLPIKLETDISQLLTPNATYDAHFSELFFQILIIYLFLFLFVVLIKPEFHTVVDLYLFPIQPVVTQMKL